MVRNHHCFSIRSPWIPEGVVKSRSPALRDDMREAQHVTAGWPDPNGMESGGRHESRKSPGIDLSCRTYGTPVAFQSQPSTDLLGSAHGVLTDSSTFCFNSTTRSSRPGGRCGVPLDLGNTPLNFELHPPQEFRQKRSKKRLRT